MGGYVWHSPNDLYTISAKFDMCQTFDKSQVEAFDEPLYGEYNVYNLQNNTRRHED